MYVPLLRLLGSVSALNIWVVPRIGSIGASGRKRLPRRKQTDNDNETDNLVNRQSRFTKLFVCPSRPRVSSIFLLI